MSRSTSLADAIVTFLNTSPTWTSIVFTAVRQLQPMYDLKEIGDIVVSVVPSKDESVLLTKQAYHHLLETDIVIAKRLAPEVDPTVSANSADADAIIEFMEAMAERFRPGMSLGDGYVLGYRIETVFDPETLKNKRVLLTALTIRTKTFA